MVCALAEGRGHAALEIGLAAIDVSAAPVLQMSQFSDNFWYSNVLTSLQALNPNVVGFDFSVISWAHLITRVIKFCRYFSVITR